LPSPRNSSWRACCRQGFPLTVDQWCVVCGQVGQRQFGRFGSSQAARGEKGRQIAATGGVATSRRLF
jgi:hypothetical protein